MSDGQVKQPAEENPYYTEEVYEYVDNRRRKGLLIGVFVLLVLLFVGVTFAVFALTRPAGQPTKKAEAETGIQWVRSIYGWGQKADQALQAPTDVAIAEDGTIWTLSGHRYIVAFNPDGTAKKVIDPEVGVSLEGLDVGDDGDVYVADYGGAVYRYNPEGKLLTTWKVELPNEVDVRDGRIAVSAAEGIAVFTHDDEVLAKFGTRGSGEDQFDLPHGILLGDDGTIFVSDTHNRRVRAYTPEGRLLWTFGPGPKARADDWRSAEASAAMLELPTGLTMDGAGRIVLVDAFKFQILALDAKTGELDREASRKGVGSRAVYGENGGQDGAFMYPTGIAYDASRDWFAVADTGNNRIQIVRVAGSGGTPLAAVTGAFRLPMLVFLLPLLLLLYPLAASLARRRRLAGLPSAPKPGSAA